MSNMYYFAGDLLLSRKLPLPLSIKLPRRPLLGKRASANPNSQQLSFRQTGFSETCLYTPAYLYGTGAYRTVFANLRVATLLQEIYVCPLSREGEPTVLRKVKEVFTATIVRVRAFVDGVRKSVGYLSPKPTIRSNPI